MAKAKKIDTRESLRIVTSNDLIEAKDLPKLSLNARKLFYLAMAQCRATDKEFYEFETTPSELAELWGVDRSNVYREADPITTELMKIIITLRTGKKSFQKRHLFEKCVYDDSSVLTFKLHKEMTDLLLGLHKNFSKPLLYDFIKMRSPYSMALWHYFQKLMFSQKPKIVLEKPFEFDVSLEELRKITGTENKLKQIGQFKERVLDKALVEIKKNCCVDITYINIKRGRFVTGFRFTAVSALGYEKYSDLPPRKQKQLRKAELTRKKADKTITQKEFNELQELRLELDQITLEDLIDGAPVEP